MKVLIEYVRRHFSFEEKLMHEHAYPDIGEHQVQHLQLADALASYDLQLKANPEINLQQLVMSVHACLMQHIRSSDKKLGKFLKKCGVSALQGQ